MSTWQVGGGEATPDLAVGKLAQEILDRRLDGGRMPTLLLGTGFAAAAGTPPLPEIARDVLERLHIGHTPVQANEESTDAFIALLKGMDAADRAAISLRTTAMVPVPQFAEEMALLSSATAASG